MIPRWISKWRRKQPSAPKMLLFDFDGTLGDTFQVGFEILNQLADEFGFHRLKVEDIPRSRAMRVGEFLSFLGVPKTRIPQIAKRGSSELGKRIHEIALFSGLKELLTVLHQRGYRLGIITSNTEENVRAFLRNHQIEMFELIRCSSKLLGKARMIRSALRQAGISKHEALYIGDEVRDIEACQKVGIRIAAVIWGYSSTESLAGQNPDALLSSPEQLWNVLAAMQGEECCLNKRPD